MEGVLLESLEGLGELPFPPLTGEWWHLLQAEKEDIAREIISDGPLRHDTASVNEAEPWDDLSEEMQRGHRAQLEERLRALNDAQDRLIDGGYGLCDDCREPINERRLRADPAASFCIACQQLREREPVRRIC